MCGKLKSNLLKHKMLGVETLGVGTLYSVELSPPAPINFLKCRNKESHSLKSPGYPWIRGSGCHLEAG